MYKSPIDVVRASTSVLGWLVVLSAQRTVAVVGAIDNQPTDHAYTYQ
jgi:hypothetical protein